MFKPNFITKKTDTQAGYAKFIITPLPGGYGHSVGNALRRVILSSIEGSAVTYIKIPKIVHVFSTIEGVKESVLDIVLNIKTLRFSAVGAGPFKLNLSVKKTGKVTAKDFKGSNIDVINVDQHIAEITKEKKSLDIEIIVEKGFGYSPVEEKDKKTFGVLAVDSVFSPIVKAQYTVDVERVGRKSNFDKLTFEIWTDGSIQPEEALKTAAGILSDFYGYILSGKDVQRDDVTKSQLANEAKKVDVKVYDTIIDELDLPTRVINALLREKIETVGDLITRGREELINLKGVGRKSIDLIEKELQKLEVSLK